jgi:hypothetical protein
MPILNIEYSIGSSYCILRCVFIYICPSYFLTSVFDYYMLIGFNEIEQILRSNKIEIDGVFHIGAHDCEELSFYNSLGLCNECVIWIDAIHFTPFLI